MLGRTKPTTWKATREALVEAEEEYSRLVYLLRKRFPKNPDGSLPDFRIEDVLLENEQLKNQVAYERLIPAVIEAGRLRGYAIAIHGSLRRDADLIACPWTNDACDAHSLVAAVVEAVGGVILDRTDGVERDPALRPHGRRAWSIHIGHDRYFDLSVMPRSGDINCCSPAYIAAIGRDE